MPLIKSCCCWRSLRRGCYASGTYTMTLLNIYAKFYRDPLRSLGYKFEQTSILYFAVTIITMGHFIEVEHRYLSGQMSQPESESFLQPDKITPILYYTKDAANVTFGEMLRLTALLWYIEKRSPSYIRRSFLKYPLVTVSLNITLLACSTLGLISCILMIVGVYTDKKFLLLPWIVSMALETLVEVINLGYLFYLQTFNFNPITAFLFTLDFFIIVLNVYTMFCVISQFQEYLAGRGTAAFDTNDRLASVQYTATAQHTTTTSSAPSGRRRSAGRPAPSRCDLEEHSEVQAKNASTFPKTSRPHVKKHVQFPDANSCIEEATEAPPTVEEKPEARVISSLWMELESETPAPER